MKVSGVIILLYLTTTFLYHTSGHITIQIETDDLQQLGEIIVQHMQDQPLIPQSRRNTCVKFIKISRSVLQMIGIILTLVGANLLTSKLEPFVAHLKTRLNVTSINISPLEICGNDFGCDENICWRSCNDSSASPKSEKNLNQSWCYTSAKSNGSEFQSCALRISTRLLSMLELCWRMRLIELKFIIISI